MTTFEKSCCFTGHRLKYFRFGDNDAHPECRKIKDFLFNTTEQLIVDKGVTNFISEGAIEVDTWAAEAVVALKEKHPAVTLEMAKQFPTTWEQFEERDRARYEKLHDRIDKVTEVSPEYSKTCMIDRNRYMVNTRFEIDDISLTPCIIINNYCPNIQQEYRRFCPVFGQKQLPGNSANPLMGFVNHHNHIT